MQMRRLVQKIKRTAAGASSGLFPLGILATIFLLCSCGYCEDEGGPPQGFAREIYISFFLADDASNHEYDPLYASDTVYPGFNYDSLTVTPLNGAPFVDFNKSDGYSEISFWFMENWDERYVDTPARLEYAIQYNANKTDTLRFEYRETPVLYRCFGEIWYCQYFNIFYNDSLAFEFDQNDSQSWYEFRPYLHVYKSPE